jgi:protein O-GlcNAc transferase
MSDVRSQDIGHRTSDIGLAVLDTEELYRLPGGMCCFGAPNDAPPVTPLPGLDRGFLTFGSMHSLFKLNSDVFDLWSEVLNALPNARLLVFRDTLTANAKERIRQEFTRRGIDLNRLDLRQGPGRGSHLSVYGEFDVCLDAFPCTGGVTTCESLWMGVPVLTLCGSRPMGRNSASILTRVGLTDWIAHSPEQFVAVSVAEAKDLNNLARLRAGLRERVTANLCDADRFTRTLEDAYRAMWRRWCEGRKD